MNQISADQLLSQIRTLGRELQVPSPTQTTPASNFGDLLKTTLDTVNETQQKAGDLKVEFITGSGAVSLAEVMIASEKARLSFQAVTEVRNKLVVAYQDIMNMPV